MLKPNNYFVNAIESTACPHEAQYHQYFNTTPCSDTPPHLKDYTAAGWSEDVIISFLQNATDLFKEFFPNTKFVMVLGNHDYFPRNQLPGSNNPIYEAAADMWTPWLKEDEAVNTFKKGKHKALLVELMCVPQAAEPNPVVFLR
jgi:hypothetical protein